MSYMRVAIPSLLYGATNSVEIIGRPDGSRTVSVTQEALQLLGYVRSQDSFLTQAGSSEEGANSAKTSWSMMQFPQQLLNEIMLSLHSKKILISHLDHAEELLGAASFLQYEEMLDTCIDFVVEEADENPQRAVRILCEGAWKQLQKVVKLQFSRWSVREQADILLRHPEILEHVSLFSGVQLLTSQLWDQADSELRTRLVKGALPQAHLLKQSHSRTWWKRAVEIKLAAAVALKDGLADFVLADSSLQHLTPAPARFIESAGLFNLDSCSLKVDPNVSKKYVFLSKTHETEGGSLTVFMISVHGKATSDTFTIQPKSRYWLAIRRPDQNAFLFVIKFDTLRSGVSRQKEGRFSRATRTATTLYNDLVRSGNVRVEFSDSDSDEDSDDDDDEVD